MVKDRYASTQNLNDEALRAFEGFITRVTVLLAAQGSINDQGSASLLVTPGGRPFLLTAAHVGETGWEPLTMVVPGLGGRGDELKNVAENVFLGPERPGGGQVDVAIVTLPEQLHDRLRPLAAGLDCIGEDDAISSTDSIFVTGFPWYLAFPTKEGRTTTVWMSTMTYQTGVKGKDMKGRLEVEWHKAIPFLNPRPLPHLDVKPGVEMDLGDPRGASGGGIWRLDRGESGRLWAPTSHARLIGIPVGHRPDLKTLYAEAVPLWRGWLREVADRIDVSR